MRVIEKAFHWAFAVFMAAVAYGLTLVAGVFLMLWVLGLPIGAKPPPNFHPWMGDTAFGYMAGAMLFGPFAAATFVGAMTAPFAQRGLAAVVFSVLVFAGAAALMLHGEFHFNTTYMVHFLETAASCAGPGAFVYFRWRRQQARLARD